MAITNLEPPPTGTPVIERTGLMQKNWLDWLILSVMGRIQAMSFVRKAIAVTGQNAAIGASVLVANAGAGVYRVSWYLQVSQVDGVSSSVQVLLSVTNLGQAITKAGANVNGNLLTSQDSGSFVVRVDGNTGLYYSTSYVSNTPGEMHYSLDVAVEAVS